MRDTLIACYIEWLNDYLTVEKWSEANGLTEDQGRRLLLLASEVYNSEHPEA